MKEYYFRLKMISEELTNDRKEFLIGTYEGILVRMHWRIFVENQRQSL